MKNNETGSTQAMIAGKLWVEASIVGSTFSEGMRRIPEQQVNTIEIKIVTTTGTPQRKENINKEP